MATSGVFYYAGAEVMNGVLTLHNIHYAKLYAATHAVYFVLLAK